MAFWHKWFSRKPKCDCGFDCEGLCIYTLCADPECDHYYCEHAGEARKDQIIYCKDHPELVGTYVDIPPGCQNAGCECKMFKLVALPK